MMALRIQFTGRLALVCSALVLAPLITAKPTHAATDSLAWTTPTALPIALARPAVATGRDGNIYVFGGFTTGNVTTNTTYIYRPASNTWSQGTTMAMSFEGGAAVTLPDGRIVVMGGGIGCANTQNCTVYAAVNAYNPTTHAWSALAPMLSPRYRFGAVLGSDGRIYAIGGWNGSSTLSSVEAYSPTVNTWSYVANLPQPEEGVAAAVTRGGAIVVAGGVNGSNFYNNTFIYSYIGNKWNSGTSMPTPRNDAAAALGPYGESYVIGGYNSVSGFLSTVEAYQPDTNSWSSVAPLPMVMAELGGTWLPTTRHNYAIGGYNGAPSSQVAVYGR